ncbi:tRNA 4-thiouridine(8) synthase ThiI [Candidatus Micrarchaeota archaeon]|nr:tRNA 4-thiouridine(8) synthase ThiI [Candidatus Micrarchaeota archaeon]
MIINIHYGEIALKGQNRSFFEDALVRNTHAVLPNHKVQKLYGRLLIEAEEKDLELISTKLKKTFGIEWFSNSYKLERDQEKIGQFALDYLKQNSFSGSIRVETNRVDKSFEINSMEFSKQVGAILFNAGFKVNLSKPDQTIYIELLENFALVYFEKIPGPGGLPVGVSGRVLCLLSGGIDSPVAALMMMKRGCIVDFLHFYAYSSAEEVKNSKMNRLLQILKEYQPREFKTYFAPYHQFYEATMSIQSKQELILFRRFILKVAEELAKQNNSLGLVTGDNLGQVASQTLDNLFTTSQATSLPLYRPLIGFDKREIINLAKKYGTYEASIEEYKDCCSLVSIKHPDTKTKVDDLEKLEEEIKIKEIIDKTLNSIS